MDINTEIFLKKLLGSNRLTEELRQEALDLLMPPKHVFSYGGRKIAISVIQYQEILKILADKTLDWPKIQAIKAFRYWTNEGLKAAKDIVEIIMQQENL